MRVYFSNKLINFAELEGIHLVQDHIGGPYSNPWNDFDFYVTFKVFLSTGSKSEKLGNSKFLAKGFNDTSKYFASGGKISENTTDISELMDPERIISLSSDLDYYRRLLSILDTAAKAHEYLDAACDGSYFISNKENFKNWPGFAEALMRSGSSSEAALLKGSQMASGSYEPDDQFSITLPASKTFEQIDFHFSNGKNLDRQNINVLIGKNGVGKTRTLQEIINGITGINKNISQPWPYFHKVVAIAYSPFENFRTKDGMATAIHETHQAIRKDSKQKRIRRRLNVNSYAYVGFRDETGVFSVNWPPQQSIDSLLKLLDYDRENQRWLHSSKFRELYSALSLHIKFDSFGLKNSNGPPTLISLENFGTLKIDVANIEYKSGVLFYLNGMPVELSSGQKIYSYILPCLMAEIEKESLVIIDEPELYLHPTLELGLLEMLKKILQETSSYAIIATHSAVMVREVEKRAVKILRRESDITACVPPSFETLGESLERITGEVFDDYYVKKPYQQSLDEMIKLNGSAQSIFEKYSQQVGDEAITYILSKVADEDPTPVTVSIRQ